MTKLSKNKKFCSVPNCRVNNNENRSFHLLPQDEKIWKRWAEVLKLEKPTRSTRICSKHFSKNDYFFPNIETKRHKLKKGVVPSQNLPMSFKTRSRRRTKMIQSPEMTIDLNATKVKSEPRTKVLKSSAKSRANSSLAEKENNAAEPLSTIFVKVESLSNNDFLLQGNAEKPFLVHEQTQTTEATFQGSRCKLSLETEDQLYEFTGLRTFSMFSQIVNFLEKAENPKYASKRELTAKDRVLLALIKLKLNLSFTCLSAFFQESPAACEDYFISTIVALKSPMSRFINWPDKEQILKSMPVYFQKLINVRIILEKIQVSIEKPKCVKCRDATRSLSVGSHLVQFLVGRSPFGTITFLSKAYGGHMRDSQILQKSTLLEKLVPNVDWIAADRCLVIEDECRSRGIKIFKLPFLSRKIDSSAKEGATPSNVSNVKSYVEKCVHRLKIFKVIEEQLSYNLIKHVDSIMTVICGLANLSAPVLPDDKLLKDLL